MTKPLRAALALGLLAGLCAAAAAQDDQKDEAKKEMEKLQGTWKTEVIAEASGRRSTSAQFGDSTLVIKDDKYVFTLGPEEVDVGGMKVKVVNKEEGTMKVNPTAKPKTMDLAITEGDSNSKGKTQLCIYELDGDVLKVTVNDAGDKERPKEMDKGVATFTFRKVKS